MIPQLNIIAWAAKAAPWPEPTQVEQDLIISRALVEIFSDDLLRQELRFRGGTALNKLHFPKPLRYSEDIDLTRTTHGPIGPIIDRLREVLDPWLGEGKFRNSALAPKFTYHVATEADPRVQIRLKVEMNTREVEAYDDPIALPFSVDNPWFSGDTEIPTFSNEELLATKLRALLQRQKGRDLFDLAHALEVLQALDEVKVVDLLGRYLDANEVKISRAVAEQRMFAKLAQRDFMQDMRPLVPAAAADALTDDGNRKAFAAVFRAFIWRLPGAPWQNTQKMAERFEVPEVLE